VGTYSASAHCPACGSLSLVDKGALPEFRPHVFGGKEVGVSLKAGHLVRCLKCDLHFRYPSVSQAVLTKLYENLPASVWECSEPRPYWPQVLELMNRYSSNRTVLDVGCFAGDFLHWLPGHWHKLGVEPNAAVGELARARGIDLVGTGIEEINVNRAAAGVITLIDVLEHLVNPFDALRNLRQLITGNGSIIVLTGAVDSVPFRIFGCDYWYSSLPEHVSFFTLDWFRWVSKELGFCMSWYRYISSKPADVKTSLPNLLRQSAYSLVRCLRRSGMSENVIARAPVVQRVARWSSPPWWREAKDHILIVLARQ
jgi:SAM-dependent methyltransferase